MENRRFRSIYVRLGGVDRQQRLTTPGRTTRRPRVLLAPRLRRRPSYGEKRYGETTGTSCESPAVGPFAYPEKRTRKSLPRASARFATGVVARIKTFYGPKTIDLRVVPL